MASTQSLPSSPISIITSLLDTSSIPGISLGAVHASKDGEEPEIELRSWGRKTEDVGDGIDLAQVDYMPVRV